MSDQRQIRILVVEDNPSWRQTLENLLVFEGYFTEIAQSVEEGLSKLKEGSYHLIVVDLNLSTPEYEDVVGQGALILREASKSTPKTPSIAVTGWDRVSPQTVRDLFKNYDINDFFWKSEFEPSDFMMAVARCLPDNKTVLPKDRQKYSAEKKPEVFLAHPYEQIWFDHVKVPMENPIKSQGYKIRHPVDAPPGGRLWHRIADMIKDSALGFYDVTIRNGNVYFELGYAMGSRKPYFALIDKGMTDASSLPRLVRGDWAIHYDSETILRNRVTQILGGNEKFHFFFEDLDKYNGGATSPFTALILVANEPRQRDLEREFAKQLKKHKYKTSTIHVEDEIDLTRLAKRLLGTTLVVGSFAADNRVNARQVNAELALVLGLSYGLGIPTIVLQEEPANVLSDLKTIVETYTSKMDLASVLAKSIVQAELEALILEQDLSFETREQIENLIQQNKHLRQAIDDSRTRKAREQIHDDLRRAAKVENWTKDLTELINEHQGTIIGLVTRIAGAMLKSGSQLK